MLHKNINYLKNKDGLIFYSKKYQKYKKYEKKINFVF